MSDKTIAEKLLIKPDYTVLILNAPAGYKSMLGELPPHVLLLTEPTGTADMIQVFISSKMDIHRDIIANYALTIGLQAVAMISIDDTWSALRLKVV